MGEHPIGSELVVALEGTWEAIRARHWEVPAAVLITGAGSGGQRREVRLGQFAASRWRLGEERSLGEIFVGGEGLSRGARMVLGTLLHEAAHALAYQRGIKDNSRQGRYHNARYRQLAEELGLEVEHDPQLGWSLTTLADDTVRGYARAIDRLERALVAYREGEHAATASTSQSGAGVRVRLWTQDPSSERGARAGTGCVRVVLDPVPAPGDYYERASRVSTSRIS